MNIQHILWSKLVASPRNARKVKADVTALAMSLAADGLIQNLTVAEREDGRFEVIAGERRRRAIVQLVRAGTWERDVEIPCEVREAEDGTGVSYAENAQRVAMHPADAIRAFASLAADGHDDAAMPIATAMIRARSARCWRSPRSVPRSSMRWRRTRSIWRRRRRSP